MNTNDIENKYLNRLAQVDFPDMDLNQQATEMAGGMEPEGAEPMTIKQFATTAADVPAGLVKGAIQGTVGLPGDIESIVYGVRELMNRGADESRLDAFLRGLEQNTVLPTTEKVKQWIDTNIGPLVPAGVTDERRREAAKTAEFVGELGGAGQMVVESAKAVARGARAVGGAVTETLQTAPRGSIKLTPDVEIEIAPSVRSNNFKNWFGDSKVVDDGGAPIVVYHGTQRPDRIGTQFRKSRATSGPMAFFTDRPELASSYATGKKDTSLAYENTDYASWFKKKEGRSKLNLDQVGARMSSQERQEVLDKLRLVGQDDQGNIVIGEPLVSDQTFDFMLNDPREAGGNPLKLANKLWLESGTLFGREEEFSKVLDAIGVKGFEQDFPTSSYPAVYPVYLSIKNPLDTSQIDQRTMYALEYNAKRQRKPRGLGNSDLWDKRRRDPKEWISQLKEDMAKGKSSMVWTSIPDWVTATLKAEGYDGIKDVGGKSGGTPHTVWIPFEENQVKSATGNIGTYSLESKNILRSGAAGAAGATGAATMQDNEERM